MRSVGGAALAAGAGRPRLGRGEGDKKTERKKKKKKEESDDNQEQTRSVVMRREKRGKRGLRGGLMKETQC